MSLPVIIAFIRGLHLAATLSLLGTIGFMTWMLPEASAAPDGLRRRLRRLWWISGLMALVAGMAWFVLTAGTMAGAADLSGLLDALPLVAADTRYGHVLMIRLVLLVVATVLASTDRRASRYLGIVLAALALGLQGLIGHAGATAGSIGNELVFSEALHLIAAGVWLGALLPLWLALRGLAAEQAVMVCERFSPVGLGCVVVVAGTGFAQGLNMIGSASALFGTTYGQIALLKITLFLMALALAALNRLWLTERLRMGIADARRRLLASVGAETCLGLAIVIAAAFMASAAPAMHATSVWPFGGKSSLTMLDEDVRSGGQVITGLFAIGAVIAWTVALMVWRRSRMPHGTRLDHRNPRRLRHSDPAT